jgi:3-deoxy-D-manno-octulosonate 8-phosphate phosphatase (KDO 8-P phosphatase)
MNVLELFKKVTTFVFDIDGVLTDGTVLVLRDGVQARQMHIKDGLGLQMAMKNGCHVFIISGGYSEEVKSRLQKLGVNNIFLAVEDKASLIGSLLEKNNLNWDELLYMGDDLPDIPLMGKVGLSCCPADAVNEVKAVANYISPVNGGWGCVRDVIEKVLKSRGKWEYDTSITSK